jgi:uncharacterized membrane protein YeaQ/YmgE (transglycosylase-associated protein family)
MRVTWKTVQPVLGAITAIVTIAFVTSGLAAQAAAVANGHGSTSLSAVGAVLFGIVGSIFATYFLTSFCKKDATRYFLTFLAFILSAVVLIAFFSVALGPHQAG